MDKMTWLAPLKIILLVFIILPVTACNKRVTPEYFLLHPEKIPPAYNRCIKDGSQGRQSECLALSMALPIFKNYLVELMDNAGEFGLKIMHSEIRLVELQKQLQLLKGSGDNAQAIATVEKSIYLENLQIQSRLAVRRFISKQ